MDNVCVCVCVHVVQSLSAYQEHQRDHVAVLASA